MIRLIRVIWLLLSTVCGVLCQSLDSSCSNEKLEMCTHNLKPLHNSQDGPVILRNEAELTEMCNQQQFMLTCINKYMDNCLPEGMRNVIKNMTSGSEDFVRAYCIGSSFDKQVYVKHLTCYNIHLSQLKLCAKRHQEWNEDLGKKPVHKEKTILQACCLYNQAMTCQSRVIRNGCPREGADFFDVLVNKATKQFHQIANCDEYYYATEKCIDTDGALSALSASSYSVLFVSTILVIFDKFCKFL